MRNAALVLHRSARIAFPTRKRLQARFGEECSVIRRVGGRQFQFYNDTYARAQL